VAQRRRHGCFTAADIALNEAVHRVRTLHVADAVLHGTLLCAGHREGEQGGKLFCIILFERIRIFAHTCAADFRDRLGVGRKLAIQILEYFDRIGFTRRRGNDHLLRDALLFPEK